MDDNDKEYDDSEEQKKQTKSNWKTIPAIVKIGAVAVFILVYLRTKAQEGSSNNLFWTALIIGIVLWWLSHTDLGGDRSPRWAQQQIKKRIKEFKEDGILPKNTEVWIEPYGDIKTHAKTPKYYMFSVVFRFDWIKEVYNMVKVYSDTGYVLFIKSRSEVTGAEVFDTYPIIPKDFKMMQKYKIDRWLWGDKYR